jgi:hypothetical protein
MILLTKNLLTHFEARKRKKTIMQISIENGKSR